MTALKAWCKTAYLWDTPLVSTVSTMGLCFISELIAKLWPTTDRGVMEKLITMGLDSITFQVSVMANRYMEKSLCPQSSAESLSLLSPLSLNYVTTMKSSLLNLPVPMPVNQQFSLSIVHCVQAAHGARYVWYVIGLGQRGYLSHPGRGTFLQSWIQSLSDFLIT